ALFRGGRSMLGELGRLGAGRSTTPPPREGPFGVGRSTIPAAPAPPAALRNREDGEGPLGAGRFSMSSPPLGVGRFSTCAGADTGLAKGASAGTADIDCQVLPSSEICSLPSSLPASSMVTMALSANGPKVFPERLRMWYFAPSPGGATPAGSPASLAGRITLKECMQAGHFMMKPEGGIRLSSISYGAEHFSQLIFIRLVAPWPTDFTM